MHIDNTTQNTNEKKLPIKTRWEVRMKLDEVWSKTGKQY